MVLPNSHVPVDVAIDVRLLPTEGWLETNGLSAVMAGTVCGADVGPPLTTVVARDMSVLFRDEPGLEDVRWCG